MTRLLDTAAALAVFAACLCADAPVLLVALVLTAAALVRVKETAPGAATSESGAADRKPTK